MIISDVEPYPLEFAPETMAVIIIDMQRDFLEEGGFGASLGNDVSLLRKVIKPIKTVLRAAREMNLLIIHTREGHEPDLSDAPISKLKRGKIAPGIGQSGPMGRLLVRGEPGHEIIPELYPEEGEQVIDKPGKGAFFATELDTFLGNKNIETLVVCGVTTEVCVHTTVREANDRGYECLVLEDCVSSYFPNFHDVGMEMIKAQGGIFGWVSSSKSLLDVLEKTAENSEPNYF